MKKEYQHKNLAAGRWFELTLVEQMGNIGSEVGRSMNWREKGNEDYAMQAFWRAMELFDLFYKHIHNHMSLFVLHSLLPDSPAMISIRSD